MARGLGTRLRRADSSVALTREQAAAADTGLKAMVPVGRPFLDYVLDSLANAGITDVCLVIGPEHDAVRERYTRSVAPTRVRIAFAVQAEARGTADAVVAAEAFIGDRPFLVLNSDNDYPVEALRALATSGEPALAAFERAALIADGLVSRDRARAWSIVETDADGYLTRIVEKPDPETFDRFGDGSYVGMNCWAFRPSILDACRRAPLSARGELELPLAVQLAIDAGRERIRVLRFRLPVLDLSTRADVAPLAARLSTRTVHL